VDEPDSVRQRLLKYAEERIGRTELAHQLKVSEPLIEAWLKGAASMPNRKLLILADLIDSFSQTDSK
jgi:hypothetical protein